MNHYRHWMKTPKKWKYVVRTNKVILLGFNARRKRVVLAWEPLKEEKLCALGWKTQKFRENVPRRKSLNVNLLDYYVNVLMVIWNGNSKSKKDRLLLVMTFQNPWKMYYATNFCCLLDYPCYLAYLNTILLNHLSLLIGAKICDSLTHIWYYLCNIKSLKNPI